MKKKILITCTDSMMKQFLEPHVIHLVSAGYDVEIACSEVLSRMEEVRNDLGSLVKIRQVHLKRSPAALSNLKGYRELKTIIDRGAYDLIWTNEPVMGVMTRLAARKARKKGAAVLYMVHGFHFYKGAPLINWLIYYPVEKAMASRADMICTINREDLGRAQRMRTEKTAYIHGVGIDTQRLRPSGQAADLRKEFGLPEDAFLVLSVGELNRNKNQQAVIRAVAELRDPKIHYILCGKGDQREWLEQLAEQLGISGQVHFAGYRKDVPDLYRQCDVFAMPSKREGLPLASLEAMYCGLPLVNSGIRGLADITEDGISGYTAEPGLVSAFAEGIRKLREDPELRKRMSDHNRETAVPFCIENTVTEVEGLVRTLTGRTGGES